MSEDKPNAIIIWRFEDAPEHLQRLSGNGGDEDWLLLFPHGMTEQNMPGDIDMMVDRLARCAADYYTAQDGRLVAITCHA